MTQTDQLCRVVPERTAVGCVRAKTAPERQGPLLSLHYVYATFQSAFPCTRPSKLDRPHLMLQLYAEQAF